MIRLPVNDDATSNPLFNLKIWLKNDLPVWTAYPVPQDVFDEITGITKLLNESYAERKSKRHLKYVGLFSIIVFLSKKDNLKYTFDNINLN